MYKEIYAKKGKFVEDFSPVFWRKERFDGIESHLIWLQLRLRTKWKLVKVSNNPHGKLDGSLLTSWTVGTKLVASASPKPMARSWHSATTRHYCLTLISLLSSYCFSLTPYKSLFPWNFKFLVSNNIKKYVILSFKIV